MEKKCKEDSPLPICNKKNTFYLMVFKSLKKHIRSLSMSDYCTLDLLTWSFNHRFCCN